MRPIRLLLLGLLLGGLVAAAARAEAGQEDSADPDDYADFEEERHRRQRKGPAEKKTGTRISTESEDETEEEYSDDEPDHKKKPKKTESDKKDPKKKTGNVDQAIVICDGSSTEACHCETNEVWCNNVVFENGGKDGESEEILNTLNVQLAKQAKGFLPVKAYFMDNEISEIRKGLLPDGMEKYMAELNLERNRVARIETAAFRGFKNISKLILTNNRLRQIRSDFFIGEISTTLHTLILRKNLLSKLDSSPFKRLKNLRKLVLDENSVILNTKTFEGLENLETLSMDYCDLEDIDAEVLKPLKKLKQLSIRGNRFSNVPRAVNTISSLELLDMSESTITELHADSFRDDHSITSIWLEDMPKLVRIDDCAFCGVQTLKQVYVNNCSKLSWVHANAFGFSNNDEGKVVTLRTLEMRASKVSEIAGDLLEWNKLTTLDLSENKINCTCEMRLLRTGDFYQDSTFPTPRCLAPGNLKNKFLSDVSTDELCGRRGYRAGGFALTLTAVMIACVFISVGFVLFRRGYRFHVPGALAANAPVAYSNLTRKDEDTEGLEHDYPGEENDVPDFQPRPQAV